MTEIIIQLENRYQSGRLAAHCTKLTGLAHVSCSGGLTLAGCQVPTKAALSLPSSAGQGRENITKRLLGPDKDRERPLNNYHYGLNMLNFRKLT